MEGSVENIPFGKTYGLGLRKIYSTDQKQSPSLSRRGHSTDGTNGNISVNTSFVSNDVSRTESMEGFSESEESVIARQLGRDFVSYKVGLNTSRPPSIYSENLRRVGDEIEEKYDISLNSIVNQLKYDPDTDGRKAFCASLDAMFEEGPCSWGRVVMVYVFAARLAKYCQDQNRDNVCIEDLAIYSGDYVARKLSQWIKNEGGWGDFCEKFKAKDWKDKAVFNSLLMTGLFLGGMATLRLLTK